MTDVENEPPANSDPPAVSDLPKSRIKKPTKPDDTEFKTQMAKLDESIQKHKARVEEIRCIIDSKRSNSDSSELRAVKQKIVQLRGEFDSILKQKQQLRQQLDVISKTRDSTRATVRAFKNKMQYTTAEKIDEQIVKLEHQLQHTSMSLSEEKKTMENIKQLKASRASVQEYQEKIEKLMHDDTVRTDVFDKIKSLDAKLTSLKTEIEACRAEETVIRDKEAEELADIPALQQERTDCREFINLAYEKKRELYADHKAKMEEWRELENVWRRQRDEDRKRRQEEFQRRKEEQDADRRARAKETQGEPFHEQVAACEQLLSYLLRHVAKEETAGPVEVKEVEAPQGFKKMKKKDEELDGFFSGLGKGKPKGKKNRKARVEIPPEEILLQHSADTLSAFIMLKVKTPHTAADVPGAIEEVKARKEYYLERRRKNLRGEDDMYEAVEEEEEEADLGLAQVDIGPVDLGLDSFPEFASGNGKHALQDADADVAEDEEVEEMGNGLVEEVKKDVVIEQVVGVGAD